MSRANRDFPENLNKEEFDSTNISRVYKIILFYNVSGCPLCPPHKGCNRIKRKSNRSWKNFRQKQYKGL